MDFLQYITQNALILIPALNILGKIIKEIDKIPDKYIPLILLPFGILGTLALAGVSVDSAVQGVLITGAAVYGNQMVKQMTKPEE